ncbi:uncharacterized protein [Acropora muricata]|uniref:uncharacterized protein LOC114973536 n=1 Tax=Acropora millepora TaxID=45264 RepID=UPI0010FC910E|nr:uncharacterized protein LOC114973536 [Acropora millepora]
MGKSSHRDLFCFLAIYCVCWQLLLLIGIQASYEHSICDALRDREVMKTCLDNYTQGFLDLKNSQTNGSGQPPSCDVDLGLAKCLSSSQCFGNLTNGLRILIFNQLVFTKRVKICPGNEFATLFKDANNALPELNKVKDMERIASDDCAFMVYVVCGSRFKDKLMNKEKIDPATLCNVFIEEGDCIKEQKGHYCAESASPILDRFQQNSKEAAKVVLPALCRIAA